MFQVTFSNQSMGELNRLDKLEQLELMDAFSSVTEQQLEHPKGDIGLFKRDGKNIFRMKSGDWRIYFERLEGDVLYALYMLHKNSLADFVFRVKLPYKEETMLERDDSFWRYLESLKK